MPDPIIDELTAARALIAAIDTESEARRDAIIASCSDLPRTGEHDRAIAALAACRMEYEAARAANPWQPGQAPTLPHAELATARIQAASAKRYWLERAAKACEDERLSDNTGTEDDAAYNRGVSDCADAIRALLTAEDPPVPPDPVQVRRDALEEAANAIRSRMMDHRERARKLPDSPARDEATSDCAEAALCWERILQLKALADAA